MAKTEQDLGWMEKIAYGEILDQANKNIDLSKGERPMTSDVAVRLAPIAISNSGAMKAWAETNKQAFGRVANPSPEFLKARVDIENLVRQNPEFAVISFEQFRAGMGPEKYANVMESLAANMQANPKFAKTIVASLQSQPSLLQSFMGNYGEAFDKGTLSEYIAQVEGRPVAATPAAPTPAPGGGGGSTATAPTFTGSTEEELDAFLKTNPQMAGLIDQMGVREKLKGVLKDNPDIMKKLKDPGQLAQYADLLKNGDAKGFLDKLATLRIQVNGQEVGLDKDKVFGEFKGALDMLGDVFGNMFGGFGEITGILGRIGAGFGNPANEAVAVAQGDGRKLLHFAAAANDPRYATEVTNNAVHNIQSGNPELARWGRGVLAGANIDPELLKQIEEGKITGFTHVKVVVGKDGKPMLGGEPGRFTNMAEFMKVKGAELARADAANGQQYAPGDPNHARNQQILAQAQRPHDPELVPSATGQPTG